MDALKSVLRELAMAAYRDTGEHKILITTIDGVCGMTVKKSASIDSLTSSIQWASSTRYTAGVLRANEAAFTSAVNRRRRASGSIVR